jgi:nicotinamidase-related amidase
MLLNRQNSALVVVDVQERVAAAIPGFEALAGRIAALVEGAGVLGVPVVALEQNPQGLGRTVAALRKLVSDEAIFSKLFFGCLREPEVAAALARLKRSHLVLAGIETHVCVMQSALTLLEGGYSPFVVADAVGSRRRLDYDTALARLAASGIGVVTTEMVLFEWLGRFAGPEARAILRLVK